MITGTKVHNGFMIRSLQFIEGESVATVDCKDFDYYQSLPDALMIGETVFGKTGWSSDTNYACYKSGKTLGGVALTLTAEEEIALVKLFSSYETHVCWIPETLISLRLRIAIRKEIQS